jgi:hypothetical protein
MMIQSKTNNHLSLIIWLGVLYISRDSSTDVMSALQIHLFMQNKPKLRKSQMNVSDLLIREYEQMDTWSSEKNKPNSKPIQTQFKPNSKPIQTQYKANSNPNKPNSNPNKPNFGGKKMLPFLKIYLRRLFAITALNWASRNRIFQKQKHDFVIDFLVCNLILSYFGLFCVSLSLEISLNLWENHGPFKLLFLLEVCF